PAAMRYTEARLTPLAMEMLADIDRDTVDWQPNYDNRLQEPVVLPSRFPNLICNGSAGIAVGMATQIPPHNLSEIVDALTALIELKRDARPNTVLAQLYKHTALQSAYAMNMLALVDGQPRVLNLKRFLQEFIAHRENVLTRRTRFDLNKAQARAHILEGLKIALDHLDAVIRTIRQSESAEKAMQALMSRYKLTEIQARAILDMQLRRLAALERKEILDELAEILKTINYLEDLLANPPKITGLVREELVELKKKFGDPRRSQLSLADSADFSELDLVPEGETVVTLSNRGYVKRLAPDTYRAQRRGGRGIRGMTFREEDAPRHMVVASTHDSILFFTDRGRVFQLKAYEIPEADRTA